MVAFAYDLINVLPLNMAVVICLYPYLHGEDIPVRICLMTVLIQILFTAYHHVEKKIRHMSLGILAAVIAGLYIALRSSGGIEILKDCRHLIWIAVVIVFSFYIEKLLEQYRRVKCTVAVLGVVTLILLLCTKIVIGKAAVIMIFAYALVTLLEETEIHWDKEGKDGHKSQVVFAFPFLAVILIAAALIKAPKEPYGWDFVKSMVQAARIRYEIIVQSLDIKKSWDNDEAEVGFSEKAGIRGNISSDAYKVLNTSTNISGSMSLYLNGKTFDTFDGRNWTKNDGSGIDQKMYDVLETVSAIADYDPQNITDYIRSDYMYIECVGVRTSHVFTPFKALPQVQECSVRQRGGDILFSGKKSLMYKIRYYRLNKDYAGYEKLMRLGHEMDEEGLNKAKKEISSYELNDYTFEGFNSYRDHIYDTYLSKVILSDRLKAHMDELLEGADSDYEKLQRIEKMLSSMDYTTHPGVLPEYVNSPTAFLDHLILDKKEGYCTHYATAFVLLARSVGIPAKYVQGYDIRIKSRETEVMSDRAHSWPEAYIRGIGWIGFEPTPGFKTADGWTVSDKTRSVQGEYSVYTDYGKRYGKKQLYVDDEEIFEQEEKKEFDPGIIYVPLTLVCIFIVIFFIFDAAYKKYRYSKMNDGDKIRYLYKKMTGLLKRSGHEITDSETLTEYAERIKNEETNETLRCLDVYERILYADKDVSKEDIELFTINNKHLFISHIKSLFGIKQNPQK